MRLSTKLIAACAVAAVLVAAVVTSFMLVGANAASTSRQTAPVVTVSTASTVTTVSGSVPTSLLQAPLEEDYVTPEFGVTYRSVAQLKQAADIVVRGQVTAVSYLDLNGAAQTKVSLKVAKCYKGAVKAGDDITIVEAGGIISRALALGDKYGPPTKEDQETKVKELLFGAPLTQVGDECLYFLGIDDLSLAVGTCYCPMGAFQGRFTIEDGVARRFVPEHPEDVGSGYASLAMDEAAIDITIAHAAAQ